MYPRTGVAGQQRIARHDGLLGRARPAGQAQPGGVGTLVGDGADGQPRLLGVLGDQHTEPGRILQGTTHHQRVVDADAVVGEHPHLARAGGHHSHLGELRSGQTHGDRPDRVHVDQPDLLAAVPHVVGDHRAVRHRRGVGHREDCREAAQSRCGRTCFDVFSVFAPGFAQMRVQVDKAGQQDLAGGVVDVGIVGDRQVGPDVGDLAVVHQHVDRVALAVGPYAPNHGAHALIAS